MLTAEEFKKRTNFVCSEVNEAYLEFIIKALNETVEEELGTLFTLQTIGEGETLEYIRISGNNLDYVKIGAWQSVLTVKVGSYGVENPTTNVLMEGRDYELKTIQQTKLPIIAIKLVGRQYTGMMPEMVDEYSSKLGLSQFLQLTGVYGWSNGLPADVEIYLMQLLNQHVANVGLTNSFAGRGQATSENDQTSSLSLDVLSFDKLDSMLKNMAQDPAFVALMNKYKQYTIRSEIS